MQHILNNSRSFGMAGRAMSNVANDNDNVIAANDNFVSQKPIVANDNDPVPSRSAANDNDNTPVAANDNGPISSIVANDNEPIVQPTKL